MSLFELPVGPPPPLPPRQVKRQPTTERSVRGFIHFLLQSGEPSWSGKKMYSQWMSKNCSNSKQAAFEETSRQGPLNSIDCKN